ncbi:MAG TPA: outer membrane beta-barrel protein, partial [Fibrobacteria bacterium]|nr:outer membrane beta-barrel protein [Fibrobacteria bacterium]
MTRGISAVALALGGILGGVLPARAQTQEEQEEPTWWIGLSGAANLNFYEGTTQRLNGSTTTPEPFHKGFGIGPYVAPSLEYRHNAHWGGMLQVGYDDRRGEFDPILCRPCDEEATLKARPAYLSIEPSLRWAPFGGGLHVFAGPRVGFLWSPVAEEKSFTYERENRPDVKQDFSAMRGVTYSGQIGLGYAFDLEGPGQRTRTRIAPFVSYQPHFGQDPRDTDHDTEWWALSTLRLGVSILFGRSKPLAGPDLRVAVRAPARAVFARRIQETFPLRNYVYFDRQEVDFAARYVRLTPQEAAAFREETLQAQNPSRATGRNVRQMVVYRNILNVLGDRLRRYPNASITLRGLYSKEAAQDPGQGMTRAEAVKRYLTATFGIESRRIAVEAAEEPRLPLGRTPEELDMLRAEGRRVEILTQSPELLVQVGEGFMLRPVEIRGEEGADSVVFSAAAPAGQDSLASWTIEIVGDSGAAQRLGPFVRAREAVPAARILQGRERGNYAATVTGRLVKRGKDGDRGSETTLRRELSFHLARKGNGIEETSRFAILFDIDQARAVSAYETFLAGTVAARIGEGSTVFIRGRTDVITDAA